MNFLTQEEKALAANAAVLLAKNKIIQAVYHLFGRLADDYRLQAVQLPVEVAHLHPKISKGENYQNLPWVMLDYPRSFTGGNVLAIRTLFWWGHSFSMHLLLQGNKIPLLRLNELLPDWYFSTATNPWQHHFDAEQSVPTRQLTPAIVAKQLLENRFYKLSSYLPLTQWDEAETFLNQKFTEAVQMIWAPDVR